MKIILSKIFEAAGRILIGLKFFLLVGESFLYIGVTSASFRLDGKLFDSKLLLNISVSGCSIYEIASLSIFGGILSGPEALLASKDLI